MMERVDRKNPLPRYYQIYLQLKNDIENNTFAGGRQLPSERVLSEQFNVNRFTVRRAIESLMDEGMVYPIRRKGYFVKSDILDVSIHRKTSYTQNMLEKNLKPRVDVLEVETREPAEELQKLFGIDRSEMVWALYFLRYYNSVPIALSRCFLPFKQMPDLNLHLARETSLYCILQKKYNIIPTRTDSVCEACMADVRESKYLSVLGDAPLLKVTSTAADQNGRYIERSITKFRSDIVKLRIDFKDM